MQRLYKAINPKVDIMVNLFKNRVAVLATMHQKERAIAPLLEQELGLKVIVPDNFNTDIFGTFSREIPRAGTQREAAKAKAKKALELTGATIALASEGAFCPHPQIPFVQANIEIIVFLDKEQELEIIGQAISTETNHNSQIVETIAEALAFAGKVGFPEHGLILMPHQAIASEKQIFKGITAESELISYFHLARDRSVDGKVYLETDMRANYNPTRMKNIEAAALNLLENIKNLCPKCSTPGFQLCDRKPGLACAGCGFPTPLTKSLIYKCQKCNFAEEKLFPSGVKYADPSQCLYCNP